MSTEAKSILKESLMASEARKKDRHPFHMKNGGTSALSKTEFVLAMVGLSTVVGPLFTKDSFSKTTFMEWVK